MLEFFTALDGGVPRWPRQTPGDFKAAAGGNVVLNKRDFGQTD